MVLTIVLTNDRYSIELSMLYIDLRPGQAVKIGNALVLITGASGRGTSGYDLDCRGVELSA